MTIIIQAGVTVTSNNNNQVLHTGNVVVFGTLNINHNNVSLNGNLIVENGGRVNLTGNLSLGTTGGCGYTVVIKTGGLIDVGTTGSDRLIICGEVITRGGGGCNPYPAGPPHYCEPAGGFTGPTGFDENGVNTTLPVKLSLFNTVVVGELIEVKWATSKEDGFDYFLIQHSNNGNDFSDLATVPGAGYDTDTFKEYLYEHNSPIVGTNYYRLKAVDLDGSYENFGPIARIFSGTRNVQIYPNPTNGEFIHVDLNFNPSEGSRLVIFNNQGIEMLNVVCEGTNNQLMLDSLKPGIYILKFISREQVERHKFIVQ